MTDGTYAYVSFWFVPSGKIMETWGGWEHEKDPLMMAKLKQAMASLKIVNTYILASYQDDLYLSNVFILTCK